MAEQSGHSRKPSTLVGPRGEDNRHARAEHDARGIGMGERLTLHHLRGQLCVAVKRAAPGSPLTPKPGGAACGHFAKGSTKVVLRGVPEHFVCQGAGRALFDLFDNCGRGRAVHVDPGLLRYIEDGRKAAHARTGMDADAGVVANNELFVFVKGSHLSNWCMKPWTVIW